MGQVRIQTQYLHGCGCCSANGCLPEQQVATMVDAVVGLRKTGTFFALPPIPGISAVAKIDEGAAVVRMVDALTAVMNSVRKVIEGGTKVPFKPIKNACKALQKVIDKPVSVVGLLRH